MNTSLFCCIAMGVFVAHLGVFMILSHLQPKRPPPPKPNFIVHSQTVVDRETGEKTVYREITVSTRIATPPPTPAPPPVLETAPER
ncbi:MAG: hypothetical protein QOE70_4272 [Chthoniobacter sp.]|nr:hypothetical protein [Chthoniobacter sp.]